MKYLITGATGFIGPYLIKKLTKEGHQCRCLVRDIKNAQHLMDIPEVEAVPGDITKPDTLKGIAQGVDVLFHLATLGHMSNFTVTEEMFEAVNVIGTRNIMAQALISNVPKVVHCSSVAAMGICRENPATETSFCRPHHPYGRSKLKGEEAVAALVKNDSLPAVTLRFSMVYGPGDWRDMLKLTCYAKKGIFPKIGNRPKLTPLIHVKDVVEALILAAQNGMTGECYLITNGASIPFDRLRQLILKGLGITRFPLYVPEAPALWTADLMEKLWTNMGKAPPVTRKNIESTLSDRVFSIDKARRELGFSPAIDTETGIVETVKWYKEKGWV